MNGRNSLSPSAFKTEEGLYHVKTEHTSPQKRYKIMRGKLYLKDRSVWLNSHHQNRLYNNNKTPKLDTVLLYMKKWFLKRSKKGHLVRKLSRLKEPVQ